MITKFETSSSSKSSNNIVYMVIGAVALYFLYNKVIKPELEKRKSEQSK